MSDSESSRRLARLSLGTRNSSKNIEASSGLSEESPYVYEIPVCYWCRELVFILTSRRETNPSRRFYRCVFAAEKKLRNDKHDFKWMDEGIIEELEKITRKLDKLHEDMVEVKEILVDDMKNKDKLN